MDESFSPDTIISAVQAALDTGQRASLRALERGEVIVVGVDQIGKHAVACVLVREPQGLYACGNIFMTRAVSGGAPPGIINLAGWCPSAFVRESRTWPESLTPITNLVTGGNAQGQRDSPLRHGHRFVSGVAARSVVAVELTSSQQSRRVAPDPDTGIFVVMVEGTLEEQLSITAFTAEGEAVPIDD